MFTDLGSAVSLVVGVVVMVRLALAACARLHRPGRATGDPALGSILDQHAGWRTHRVAALVVDADSVRAAYVAANSDTRFELGSVSKVFTALLTADAIDRGAISGETTLGELLRLTGSPVSGVTVDQLVTHTSGLPRLPSGIGTFASALAFVVFGTNPYGRVDPARLVTTAGRIRMPRTPTGGHAEEYSNLGVSLLGHAVASADSVSFDDAVRTRICDPLRMSNTEMGVRRTRVSRGWRGGLRPRPWATEGYGPAAGMSSTPGDMAMFARALVAGQVRGLTTSLAPRDERGRALLWQRGRAPDSVWHNGETGGYSAYVALSHTPNPHAIVLLADHAPVDDLMRIAADVHTHIAG